MNKQKSFLKIKKRKPPVPWGGFRGLNAVTESDVWLDAVRQKYKQNQALQSPTQKYFNKQRAFLWYLKKHLYICSHKQQPTRRDTGRNNENNREQTIKRVGNPSRDDRQRVIKQLYCRTYPATNY